MTQLVPKYDSIAFRRDSAVFEIACSPYRISIVYLSFYQIDRVARQCPSQSLLKYCHSNTQVVGDRPLTASPNSAKRAAVDCLLISAACGSRGNCGPRSSLRGPFTISFLLSYIPWPSDGSLSLVMTILTIRADILEGSGPNVLARSMQF